VLQGDDDASRATWHDAAHILARLEPFVLGFVGAVPVDEAPKYVYPIENAVPAIPTWSLAKLGFDIQKKIRFQVEPILSYSTYIRLVVGQLAS